jgi:hypothetical protein
MSNLGAYQVMTTLAKRVGGPCILMVLTMVTGWAIGRSTEAGGKTIRRRLRQHSQNSTFSTREIFTVTAETTCGSGLILRKNDKFRVLERDDDAVLVEVMGDAENPYFVSAEILAKISNFPGSLSPEI